MNKHVPGVHVPDSLIMEMENAQDKVATSVAISVRIINQVRPLCAGVHLMPIGWDKHVPAVLDAAGL